MMLALHPARTAGPWNCYRRNHVYMGVGTLKRKGGSDRMSLFGDCKFNLVPVEFDGYKQ